MDFLLRTACYLALILSSALFAGAQQTSFPEPPLTAQETQPPAPTPSPQEKNAPQSAAPSTTAPSTADQEKEILKKEQSQRILGVVPMFATTSRLNAPPLTTGQKFHLFAKSSFDPFEYAAAGLQAGLGQATNEFSGYGQGAEGYAKRYGASVADQVSSNFFSNFFYPTLLKEDPRYFRLGEGSIKHRIGYSLAQEFVCHTDRGGRSFNFSNAFGAFTSGGISNLYYPSTDRGFSLTISRSAVSLLYGTAGGLVDEFWPDINRKLFHNHPKDTEYK
jgi:hypothetical protein